MRIFYSYFFYSLALFVSNKEKHQLKNTVRFLLSDKFGSLYWLCRSFVRCKSKKKIYLFFFCCFCLCCCCCCYWHFPCEKWISLNVSDVSKFRWLFAQPINVYSIQICEMEIASRLWRTVWIWPVENSTNSLLFFAPCFSEYFIFSSVLLCLYDIPQQFKCFNSLYIATNRIWKICWHSHVSSVCLICDLDAIRHRC